MKKTILMLLASTSLLLMFTEAQAVYKWSDAGNPYGPGIGVNLVYPEWDHRWVIFRTTDGKFYYFAWDSTSAEITSNGKTILSMLLSAMNSGQKVSLYYDDANVYGGSYIPVLHVNVHD